jgi:hypothetical protein
VSTFDGDLTLVAEDRLQDAMRALKPHFRILTPPLTDTPSPSLEVQETKDTVPPRIQPMPLDGASLRIASFRDHSALVGNYHTLLDLILHLRLSPVNVPFLSVTWVDGVTSLIVDPTSAMRFSPDALNYYDAYSVHCPHQQSGIL